MDGFLKRMDGIATPKNSPPTNILLVPLFIVWQWFLHALVIINGHIHGGVTGELQKITLMHYDNS
jgi:hypothetical protein